MVKSELGPMHMKWAHNNLKLIGSIDGLTVMKVDERRTNKLRHI